MSGRKFEQLTVDSLKAMSLESDYLMSLHLSPEELQERFGIEFSELSEKDLFAAIKDLDSGFIFQFDARPNGSGTSVTARGTNVDVREAYTVFMQTFKLNAGREISWISDAI